MYNTYTKMLSTYWFDFIIIVTFHTSYMENIIIFYYSLAFSISQDTTQSRGSLYIMPSHKSATDLI